MLIGDILLGGVGLGVASALCRRRGAATASYMLVAGAFIALAVSVFDWVFPASEWGQASVDSNRRMDQFAIACELPVFILALISLAYFPKWAFRIGWTINLAYAAFWAFIIIWLEFFWHW